MAKVKNVSGEDRIVPALNGRLVLAGATADVPAEDVYGFTMQESIWQPADDEARAAHDEAAPKDNQEPVTEMPAKNASTETWARYAVDSAKATPADVEGKSRDELVALYGPEEV